MLARSFQRGRDVAQRDAGGLKPCEEAAGGVKIGGARVEIAEAAREELVPGEACGRAGGLDKSGKRLEDDRQCCPWSA